MKRFTAIASFLPGERSTPLATSTPQGCTSRDRRADVVRRQAAGEDQLHRIGGITGERPVEHPARARLRAVNHDQVGAVFGRSREVGITGAERLDHPSERLRNLLGVGSGFASVQLDRLDAGLVSDVDDQASDVRCGTPRR